ncbi:tryptophan-rich sensory protein [bacterium]|nr:tryptophan-rich sensory protein [bacterium]
MTGCALIRPHAETADEHRTRSWVGVGLVVAACLAVQAVSAAVTVAALRGDWYITIPKPEWTPPDRVFGPVWAALFLMMAAAGSLVWLARDREDVCCPLVGFGLQLAANLAWTVLFFGLHRPFLAFLDVLVLWVLVGLTALHFFEASRPAGWLMVPYWLWVSFVAVLNGAILAQAV